MKEKKELLTIMSLSINIFLKFTSGFIHIKMLFKMPNK